MTLFGEKNRKIALCMAYLTGCIDTTGLHKLAGYNENAIRNELQVFYQA